MKTLAQRFKTHASRLMPQQSDLQDLDDSIGGMAAVILALIEQENT